MAENTSDEGLKPKAYQPSNVEQKWYKYWLEKGYFTPRKNPKKQPFVIIMPPPNITGQLHIGHALTVTVEDIMVRWHRMMGEPTLWLPGVDHAGIATQMVVEKDLAKEGKTRAGLGRKIFVDTVWEWANKYRHRILVQHQRLGASCDWSRETFTLDDAPCKAVRATFVNLYKKGLIYRGERIINWCPRCLTAISDLEVDYKELQGNLYHLRYPLEGAKGKYVTVATTRPETMLGDTAVAVNPADERYKDIIGKRLVLPLVGRKIPIVADEAVDKEFGSGAVKVTPSHDPTDFDIAQRHNLPLITILDNNACLNENAGAYCGLSCNEGRKKVIEDLEKEGLLLKVEPYNHSVGHCHRCAILIEPIASRQWFVKTEPLAKPAIEAVKNGSINIIPRHFTKVYLNWMENIKDWCISRQLWWGHRIPVWYCRCGEVIVDIKDPTICPKCASQKLEQDPDVLDTWFSSGLWPHSTLGWPDDENGDLDYFYPTAVMETAYDILFFWVARMIMLGIENTGKIPFHTVYLHGLIRDEKGIKMSKTKGNVIDPLDVIDKYGTDALRFALLVGNTSGNDAKLSIAKLEAGRNFANKLWNATRFVLGKIGEEGVPLEMDADKLKLEDFWIISRLNSTIKNVTRLMEEYQFGEAQRQIHEFIWGDFCDWYIELAKVRLRGKNAATVIFVLMFALDKSLRLLHPYMPFVTEELWQQMAACLPKGALREKSIMISAYPKAVEGDINAKAEETISTLIEMVRGVRNIRAQHKVEAKRYIEAIIYPDDGLFETVSSYKEAIATLARVKPLKLHKGRHCGEAAENELLLVYNNVDVLIPMVSMVDTAAVQERRQREIKELEGQIERLGKLLVNKGFTAKAPAVVVNKERVKLNDFKEKLDRLKDA